MSEPVPPPMDPAADDATRRDVVDVEVQRDQEVRVQYADGVQARFPVLALRRACPCAGCRGRRERGELAYAGEEITIVDAELHGAWAISLRWSDGHDTGIYAWSYLREWWDLQLDGDVP